METTPSGREKRRIWILTRHYPPDAGPLAYRMEHLARVLAEDHDVTVLASQPNRYRHMTKAPRREERDGLTIRRITAAQLLRGRGKAARLITELLGALSMAVQALRHRRKMDVVVASIPPFFYSMPGWIMKRIGRIPLLLDVRDLWLDWAEETRLVRPRSIVGALRALESAVIRSADEITVTTNGFRDVLLDRYMLDQDRVTVVYNGLDDRLKPRDVAARASRAPDDPVNIVYAGNLGPSQNLLGISEGIAASLVKWPKLTVTIAGDGAQRSELATVGHDRLRVLPHMSRADLAALYEEADAFLLHLADLEVYRHTVPSKVFEYAAYGRPILCGVQGEARQIASRHTDCYTFDSDDSESFARAVDRLCSGESPDNAGEPRADDSEILRSSRAPVWRAVIERVA